MTGYDAEVSDALAADARHSHPEDEPPTRADTAGLTSPRPTPEQEALADQMYAVWLELRRQREAS